MENDFLTDAQMSSRAKYVAKMKRRRDQIEAALKPGDTIVIEGGFFDGMKATYVETKLLGREVMAWFDVETPKGTRRQHFGPVKLLKTLGIPDKD